MTDSTATPDRLDLNKVHFTRAAGLSTRFYEGGTGEPLVLVHGGTFGSYYSLDAWSLDLPWLERWFHVYAFDKVGQGFTDGPGSDAEYVFGTVYDHFRAFLEDRGIAAAHLVGHSRGALPALCYALDHPERVRSLVLVASSTAAPDDRSIYAGDFYQKLARRMPPGPPSRETLRIEPEANSFSTGHISEDFLERMLEIARRPQLAAVRERIESLQTTRFLPDINRWRANTLRRLADVGLTVPTLVIWGWNDPSAPVGLAQRLFQLVAARTRHAEMHIFNQAGHYVYREHAESFSRSVADFCLKVALG